MNRRTLYILFYESFSLVKDKDAIASWREADGWYCNQYVKPFVANSIRGAKKKARELCDMDEKIFSVSVLGDTVFTEED